MRHKVLKAAAVAVAATAVVAPAAAASSTKTLFASTGGAGAACTAKKPCRLADAIRHASAGATVHVAKGRYAGGYLIDHKVRLIADGRAVIDASTSADGTGIHIVGPGGSGSLVQGFVVERARYEGILVGTSPGDVSPKPAPVTDVTLRNNIVVMNNMDRGNPDAAGECKSTPPAPADCGGGIHLVWVGNSTVQNNVVAYNSDGILLTDEFGPTAHNVVRGNRTIDNFWECGIVLAGHSPKAVGPDGKLTGQAGVFDNLIENNTAIANGIKTTGAGILLGGGAPGSAVYANTIRNNTVANNGHAGITIHQHLVGDLNGNVIENNTVGTNNGTGDNAFAAALDMQTTGILVASGAPPGPALPPFLLPSPISGTVIHGNKISGDAVGIWTLNAPGDFTGNTFAADVATPVSSH
jgi:nitrous oxidase accessory protein NosD